MRVFKYFQFFIYANTLFFMGCQSHKKTVSGTKDKTNYAVVQAFNKHYYDGAKLKALGDYVQAASEFKLALAQIPKSHEAMYQLANIYFKDKKLEESIYWADQAVKNNANYNFWYYGQLAQMYSTAKQYDKAASAFAIMVEKEPERRSNYEEAGNQYLNAKKPKEAIKFFEKSILKFGAEEGLCRKLEDLYFDTGQPNEAVRIIKKLSDAYPTDIKFLGLLAESLNRANKISEAKLVFIKILKLDETNGFASFGMADILRKEEKTDESFYYLSRGFADKKVSIQHKLKVIASYYFLITKDEKSKNQAFELCEKLLAAHPDDALSYQVYSDMLMTVKKVAESREYLKKGLVLDGKDYRIWQKLFALDIKLSNNQFLYEDSKMALELFTSQPGIYIIHSQAAFRIEDYDRAIETAMNGLDISFKSEEKIELYVTLGNAWFAKGNYEKTDEYFEKALETDQQNAVVLNNYAYNLYKRNTKLAKAEELVLKALALNPNSGSYADTYGCVLLALGKLTEAENWINKALKLEGENAEVLEHLGDIYTKQGKLNMAVETYKKALDIDPENKLLKIKINSVELK